MVKELLESLIFWDSKRPITTGVLNKLDLRKIAAKLNYSLDYNTFLLYSTKFPDFYIYIITVFRLYTNNEVIG
ncbi:MAG: hypothetical protein EBS19_14635 [Spirochaetia bacterium]|nr:hypothetical protein [Spirochaetia bacterium]